MLPDMRRHFSSHWRVWLLIAATVILANELVDRNFFDHREHIDGDVVIAVVAVAIAFLGSYLVARRKSGDRRPNQSESCSCSVRGGAPDSNRTSNETPR